MKNNLSSFDYKLKSEVRSRDMALIRTEAAVLRVLSSTLVVRLETKALADYYGDIFDVAVGRLRFLEPIVTRAAYVATSVGTMENDYTALRDPHRLADVSGDEAGDFRDQLDRAVANISHLGAALPEEKSSVHYGLCRLQGGDVGTFPNGQVFVRRTSAIADVLFPLPQMSFDGSRVKASQPSPPRKRSAAGADAQALPTITAMTDAAYYIHSDGPITTFLKPGISAIKTLWGKLQKKEKYNEMLSSVSNILETSLSREVIREQLAHIQTWNNQVYTMQSTLEQSQNPVRYIEDTYLVALDNQLEHTYDGSVPNAVNQLRSVWEKTPWVEMDILEDTLKALGLGLGAEHLIYRDRVILNAWAAAHYYVTEGVNGSNYMKYYDRTTDAHSEYGTIFDAPGRVTPQWLSGKVSEWETQRGIKWESIRSRPAWSPVTPYSLYFGYRNYIVVANWHVVDDGNDNGNRWLYSDEWSTMVNEMAETYTRNEMQRLHTAIVQEAYSNLIPIRDECTAMVEAFNSLVKDPPAAKVAPR